MPNVGYDNFFLQNEIEDQLASRLNLIPFCTVVENLMLQPGMKYKENVYSATNGTQKLTKGEGNTQTIEVSYTPSEHDVALAQNQFLWYDEDAETDPLIVETGLRHGTTDMVNTIMADIYSAFASTSVTLEVDAFDFDAFVDGISAFGQEGDVAVGIFAFVHPNDTAAIRKGLGTTLQYVEAYARTGYIGTVAGVNVYVTKRATAGAIILGTRKAVKLVVKTGTEIEIVDKSRRGKTEANTRENAAYTRKYYVVFLSNEAEAIKLTLPEETETETETPDPGTQDPGTQDPGTQDPGTQGE